MQTRTGLLIAVVVAAGCGTEVSGSNWNGSGTTTALPKCKKPTHDCHSTTCGGNSPIANSFPVMGVRPNGDCAPDGLQLVADLITTDPQSPCKNATLDLVDGKLVGSKNKKIACSGQELTGASFVIQNWAGTPQTIKIKSVTTYSSAFYGADREAYELVNASPGENPTDALCAPGESTHFRSNLGLPPLDNINDAGAAATDYRVIAVNSELYESDGWPVIPRAIWQDDSPEWIHLACVNDAIAKRSIYGLYSDDVSRSRKALRMLTADYCGGLPATNRGVEVRWNTGTMIEAQWNENGAACLSEPRLLHTTPGSQTMPPSLPQRIATKCGAGCDVAKLLETLRKCDEDPTDPTNILNIPPCGPVCPPNGCPLSELDSFISNP
jgi:hypothetical protein